jgi:hypothetical protein
MLVSLPLPCLHTASLSLPCLHIASLHFVSRSKPTSKKFKNHCCEC